MGLKANRKAIKKIIEDLIKQGLTYEETEQYLRKHPWNNNLELTMFVFNSPNIFPRSRFSKTSSHQNEDQQKKETETKINKININTSQEELNSIQESAKECKLTDQFNKKKQQIEQQKQQAEEKKQKKETEEKINSITINTPKEELDAIKILADQYKLIELFNQRIQQIEQQKQQSEERKQKKETEEKINSITINTPKEELDAIKILADQYKLIELFNQRIQQIEQQKQQSEEQQQKQEEQTQDVETEPEQEIEEQTQDVETEPEQEIEEQTQDVETEPEQEIEEQTQDLETEPEQEIEEQTQEVETEPEQEIEEQTQEVETEPEQEIEQPILGKDYIVAPNRNKAEQKEFSLQTCHNYPDGWIPFHYNDTGYDGYTKAHNESTLYCRPMDECKNSKDAIFCESTYSCTDLSTLHCDCTIFRPFLDLISDTKGEKHCITKERCEKIGGKICLEGSCIQSKSSCNKQNQNITGTELLSYMEKLEHNTTLIKEYANKYCGKDEDGNDKMFRFIIEHQDLNKRYERPPHTDCLSDKDCKELRYLSCPDIYACVEKYTLNCDCTPRKPVLNLIDPINGTYNCITKTECQKLGGELCPDTSCGLNCDHFV